MSILPDIWYCGLHDYNKALVQNNQFVSQNRASYTDKWLETDACHTCTYSCVNRNVFFNSSLNISELHKNHMMKSPKVIYKIARCIFGGFEYNV